MKIRIVGIFKDMGDLVAKAPVIRGELRSGNKIYPGGAAANVRWSFSG